MVLNQIRLLQPGLSKSEKKVADTVLQAPQQYVKATLSQLALAAQVSEPTIVRFCRSLALSGYREFRLRLAQDLASQVHYQHSQINSEDSAAELIDKVTHGAMSSLTRIRSQLVSMTIDHAISALSISRNIQIYAVGGVATVVQDAQLKFARLGLPAQAYCDSYLQPVAAAMLDANSCVLAISNSGRSKDLMFSINIAQKNQARIIAIAPSATPLSTLCDLHLAVDVAEDEGGYLNPIKTRIAQMAIIDILAIGLAVRCEPGYLERLQQANQVLTDKFIPLAGQKSSAADSTEFRRG